MPAPRTWFDFQPERAHALGVRADDVQVICTGDLWQALWTDGTQIGDVAERGMNVFEVVRWRAQLAALESA